MERLSGACDVVDNNCNGLVDDACIVAPKVTKYLHPNGQPVVRLTPREVKVDTGLYHGHRVLSGTAVLLANASACLTEHSARRVLVDLQQEAAPWGEIRGLRLPWLYRASSRYYLGRPQWHWRHVCRWDFPIKLGQNTALCEPWRHGRRWAHVARRFWSLGHLRLQDGQFLSRWRRGCRGSAAPCPFPASTTASAASARPARIRSYPGQLGSPRSRSGSLRKVDAADGRVLGIGSLGALFTSPNCSPGCPITDPTSTWQPQAPMPGSRYDTRFGTTQGQGDTLIRGYIRSRPATLHQ